MERTSRKKREKEFHAFRAFITSARDTRVGDNYCSAQRDGWSARAFSTGVVRARNGCFRKYFADELRRVA